MYYGDEGFACGGRNAYDLNGYTVCDCYACEQEALRDERREADAQVDWTQFPKQIATKVNSKCESCSAPLPAGSLVMWDGPRTGVVRCLPGACKPAHWQKYPEQCPKCDEPYTHQECLWQDQEDGRGEWVGVFGCGSTIKSGFKPTFSRSSGCRTITRLRAMQAPTNHGLTSIEDLTP